MISILVSIPLLGVGTILQTAILSRIVLLSGHADLMLLILTGWGLQRNAKFPWIWAVLGGLMVGSVSALPMLVPVAGYLAVMGLARLLHQRIWQAPMLGMFGVTFIGSLLMSLLTTVHLWLSGNVLALGDVFVQVMLPATLLNLLLAIPVHAMMRDLAGWLSPEEVER